MQNGRFQIEQLSEGRFRIFNDGTILRVEPEEKKGESDELSSLRDGDSFEIGIGPVLVRSNDCCMLLDTGLGWGLDAGSPRRDLSNVVTNLEIFDLTPDQVTHVVLSHLHYDHAAGATYTDQNSRTVPTFPNARYWLQKKEWDWALDRYEMDSPGAGAGYELDELFRLAADGRMELLEGDTDILDGIRVIRTGGHTPGHQAVRLEDGGERLWYLGDLLPDDRQLNHYAMQRIDSHPLQAKKMKFRLLRQIFEEQATLLFYHSLHARSGILQKDENRQYILEER